jgi:Amt family ammonium transporter
MNPALSPADTVWVMMATAMVMLMTPGLALFYGGLVQARNVLSTKLHSFSAIGLVTVQWVVLGYSLSFAEGNAFLGGLDYVLLQGVGQEPGPYAATIPHLAFMAFQMMFAIITPAIISGAFAERMKFSAYVLFTLLWATLVYDPICHWVWGRGGWMAGLGALDFAGGTVVHVSSGVAGLTVAWVLGPRRSLAQGGAPRPHNLSMVTLGAGLLWFGWFGFNAGSALAANGTAVQAFVTTHAAAAAGVLGWSLTEHLLHRRTTLLGVASGGVAGLVAITPACAFVTVPSALVIGLTAGVLCTFGVLLKERLGADDALDAFGLHGVGGAWGAVATGLFASRSLHAAGGFFEGNAALLGVQVFTVAATALYSFGATWLIVTLLDRLVGLRVDEEAEAQGLDRALHGQEAYAP